MAGLSKSIKQLIVAIYRGQPLRQDQTEFVLQLEQDLKEEDAET